MKAEKPKNKKPLIYYYFVMMIALMAFNLFVTPMIQNQRIKEVGYSDLIAALEEKQVDVYKRQCLYRTKCLVTTM